MTKVAVVILNFNGRKMLEQFLPNVLANTPIPHEVIVADNGSTDNSVTFLQENFPQVRLLTSIHNEGFSGGYNTALKQVEADYYVLLNSDVEVSPNWIEPVLDVLQSNPQIVAAQPKIRAYHAKDEFEYAGAAGGYIDYLGYPFCRGRIFNELEKDLGQYDDNREIFWATGACMFIKAEVYHQLGGLDVDFFAHMEEIDLCWRINNAGHKIYYCAQSTVYHVGGGTLHKSNPRKTFLNFRNGLVLLYKNSPSKGLFKIIFIRLCLDGIAALKFLSNGGFGDFKAVFFAHMNFYKYFSIWNKKRKEVLSLKKIDSSQNIAKKSIVWQHFKEGKKIFNLIEF